MEKKVAGGKKSSNSQMHIIEENENFNVINAPSNIYRHLDENLIQERFFNDLTEAQESNIVREFLSNFNNLNKNVRFDKEY